MKPTDKDPKSQITIEPFTEVLAEPPLAHPLPVQPQSIVRSAMAFGSGTMVSRVLGFSRDAILANILPREVTDAYTVAFRIPNLFRRLLGEGALSVSFIPNFVDIVQRQKDMERGKALVNSVFTLLMVILSVITVLAIVFMKDIVLFLVPGEGFTSFPGKIEMTVEIARWSFGFILFICLFALYMAILNGLKKFWLSGVAPALMNVTLIVGTLLTLWAPNRLTVILGVSTLLAGLFQWLVLIPSVRKSGFQPHFTKKVFTEDLKNVLRPLGPSLIGLGSFQITTFINTNLVSNLAQGTLTYINMADRVLELPLSLIAVSLQTALLPTLSQYWAEGNIKKMVGSSQRALRLNYYLAIPSALGMYVLSEPIVKVLFDWKGFGANEIAVTAAILRIYALTLITAGGVRIVAQNYYAMKDTWTPAKVAMGVTALHLPMAWWMTKNYGLSGLNYATFLTSLFNLTFLSWGLKKRLLDLQTDTLLKAVLKFLAAAGLMAMVVRALRPFIFTPFSHNKISSVLALGALVAIGGVIYFIASALLRCDESSTIIQRVSSKFFKKSV